ncbi:CaiB/BaiF CoA transferase family protein [Gephyromycinifex aptenodytis]|uniref:CaiB/BaiF CoA transferase family protein n=1 Tax=Gephyromycinifex aptenodytis TaxID=2716227 RepID=UPI0014486918|nr:CoA transferase [Gephyromycinifex aptenodytis]
MSGPLDGVLIADFSRVLAGPLATMTLADLGATVIKVERPGAGDDTRAWGPPWSPHGATYFESANRSKQSLTLDLSDAADLVLAQELAQRADVFFENFRPGALARFRLDYESVRERNPQVVYTSISGFGAGAGADLPGYDFVVQALGGLMSVTGAPAGEPTKVGVALVDVLTGKDATIGTLAALAARDHSGHGAHVEVNLLSSLLGAMVNQASGYLGAGSVPRAMGNQHPSIAPYETLRARDGIIAVACGNDGQFAKLAAALGIPGLAQEAEFATNVARVQNRPRLILALEERLATKDVATWQRELSAVGVPAGAVNSLPEAFALAEELGLAPTYDLPGASPQVRHPVRYSDGVLVEPSPPPRLGEHSAALRAWLAGPADAAPPRLTPPVTPPTDEGE